MMNCQTFERYLVDYLEGTLSSKDTHDVDAHLEQCVHCQTLLAEEQEISEKLHQLPPLKCPEQLIDTVLIEIKKEQAQVTWRERLQWWFVYDRLWKFGVTAAAIAVLVVMVVFYEGGDTPQIQPMTYSPEELEQAKQDIALTLAYVRYYTEKTENILEDQLVATRAAIRQPVRTVLEDQLESTQAAIRRPVETKVKEALTSIIDGGTL